MPLKAHSTTGEDHYVNDRALWMFCVHCREEKNTYKAAPRTYKQTLGKTCGFSFERTHFVGTAVRW